MDKKPTHKTQLDAESLCIREIIGDPKALLMQDEFADRIRRLVNVLRHTVGIMDSLQIMQTLPGTSSEERLMARIIHRQILEMLEHELPEWDAICQATTTPTEN